MVSTSTSRGRGTRFTITVPEKLLDVIKQLADAEHRTTNLQIAALVEEAVVKREGGETPPRSSRRQWLDRRSDEDGRKVVESFLGEEQRLGEDRRQGARRVVEPFLGEEQRSGEDRRGGDRREGDRRKLVTHSVTLPSELWERVKVLAEEEYHRPPVWETVALLEQAVLWRGLVYWEG